MVKLRQNGIDERFGVLVLIDVKGEQAFERARNSFNLIFLTWCARAQIVQITLNGSINQNHDDSVRS